MNERQKVVAATLSALDIPLKVDALEDRKALQKALYLAQEAGVDLGYLYGWHQFGPYSPELAGDYQEAAYTYGLSDEVLPSLRKRYRAALSALRPALEPPNNVDLSKTQWLELLASVHFLRKYVGQTATEARATIHRQKRSLSRFSSVAEQRLMIFGLG